MAMRHFLRKWRYPLLAGGALVAFMANLPDPRPAADGAQARQAEVISAFFNLTAEPGAGGLNGLRLDWLVRDEWRRERRRERLAHIHPDLLAAHAHRLKLGAEGFRELLIDPNRPDPFDIAGVTLAFPETAGQAAGEWSWVLVAETVQAEEDGPACDQWLVFWDASTWYFAPVGMAELNDSLKAALPALAGALPGPRPGCAP